MSLRRIPIFDRAGRPTVFMMRRWLQKDAQEPLALIPYLQPDRTAAPHFRRLWQVAFPTRPPLPVAPLADRDGRGTDAFWDLFG